MGKQQSPPPRSLPRKVDLVSRGLGFAGWDVLGVGMGLHPSQAQTLSLNTEQMFKDCLSEEVPVVSVPRVCVSLRPPHAASVPWPRGKLSCE